MLLLNIVISREQKKLNLSEDFTDQTQNPDCSHMKLVSDAQQGEPSIPQIRQKTSTKK